jgi:nucleoside-diphosphate-sugar epimerase
MNETLVILGCGFTGTVAARMWLEAGGRVIGTIRSPRPAESLSNMGIDVRIVPRLDAEIGLSLLNDHPRVLVTYPPDPETDRALLPLLSRARAAVYVSSTGVYGNAAGRIDESTPVDPSEPRAALRLAAERFAQMAGAVVLRAAAIYGPGRGLHVRLVRGEHRIAEGARNVVSRIHVQDLARLCLAALERGNRGDVFVVADNAPVPQAEVISWLCEKLGLPLPPEIPREQLPVTLQNNRHIDARKIQESLGMSLQFPTYREGFMNCFEVEARG